MKILLIMPDGKINKFKFGPLEFSFREAPLTLTMLAALVPPELQAKIRIVDESVGTRVPFDADFDLVGISVMTGTAIRGYTIADRFRGRGIPVVLGGVHVTLRPQEAAAHADAIVSGFAERTWPQLLRDLAAGRMQSHYAADSGCLTQLPVPRRDLQKKWGYLIPHTVMVTRGCLGKCGFCSVPAAGFGWQKRPVAEVIAEIRQIKSRRFAISDVHLTQEREYAKEFLRALIPLKKKWGALASTRVVDDDELLKLLQQSGCSYLLLGFESFNTKALQSISKGSNRVAEYKNVVEKLHDAGITIQGCFIFGFDDDEKTVFRQTLELINELKIDIPRYALFTPYPETAVYHTLKAAGRLLHENWHYYDTQHVVIIPRKMTCRELEEGFKWVYKNTFKVAPSFRRSLASGWNAPITFTGNLAYKLYIKRLYADPDRFPAACAAACTEAITAAVP